MLPVWSITVGKSLPLLGPQFPYGYNEESDRMVSRIFRLCCSSIYHCPA